MGVDQEIDRPIGCQPRLAAIPLVVCSSDGRLVEQAEAPGTIDQLRKPIDHRALLKLAAHCSHT